VAIVAFTGDPYLAREAAFDEARLRGLPTRLLPASPETLAHLLQPALFSEEEGILDMREVEEAAWKEIKDLLDLLAQSRDLLVYDPHSTSGRTRFYKNRGEVRSFPTPRFRERTIFVQNLLKKRGLKAPAAVVHLIAESEADTEGLVREVEKLELLPPPLTPDRVRPLLAWPAATSAFDLLAPLARGEIGEALAVAHDLLERGEAPLRVVGALGWNYTKLSQIGFLLEQDPHLTEAELAKRLGVAPYAARRLLESYRRLGQERVERALEALLEAELAIKTGADPELRLTALLFALAGLS